MPILAAIVASAPLHAATPSGPASMAEHQRQCAGKDGWSDPAPPVRIFANVYDVGSCGITVLLITGAKGHILIDGATAQAVPAIIANIERLGVRPRDVKYLLSTHEHVDHAGGLHALHQRTGASLIASAAARPMLESGTPARDDPQHGGLDAFTGARVGRIVRDGEAVTLGSLRLTAHLTPGHSPGGTSWSWTACAGKNCRRIVYADSLSAVSADGYRFADHPAYVARLRTTIAKVAALRCDLLITPHPSASALYDRLAGTVPLIDSKACARYAAAARSNLDKRLAREAATVKRR
ncbi:MAG: subclass B3 metallo-beta-lactamase [Sphingobium sp.]|nr:MAG: subclass B3 metallo-beta-lactamase [Sphingobium sp.]